jgi:hypothetical protein
MSRGGNMVDRVKAFSTSAMPNRPATSGEPLASRTYETTLFRSLRDRGPKITLSSPPTWGFP